MKLIAGLGNPGREYERTPHNAGFRAVDALCASLGAAWKSEPRHKAETARAAVGSLQLLLVKPQTFMNLSGDAVSSLSSFYKIPASDVIVISDDVNLQPGRIRIRPDGGCGGHNGLRSVAERLGTQAFVRVRVGVGMGHRPVADLADRVLGRIEPEDEAAVASGISLAAEAALFTAARGAEEGMNKYNGTEVVASRGAK